MEKIIQFLLSSELPAGIIAALIVVILSIADRCIRYRADIFDKKSSRESREREILSSDQHTFRASILDQLKAMQLQVNELQRELDKTREEKLLWERRFILLVAHVKAIQPNFKFPPEISDFV